MIWRTVLSILAGSFAFGLTFYTDAVRALSAPIQWLLFVLVAALVFYSGTFFDYLGEVQSNRVLKSANAQLMSESRTTTRQLSELQRALLLFMENSEIYREKVAELLKVSTDYLCIVKSSEGLGEVREVLAPAERTKYPFGKVLRDIPGAVEPFEHAGMFLIPTKSLPGITPHNIRKYVGKVIIPQVAKERRKYLSRIPAEVSARAEELSFKYIAFLLRKDSITYETRNRKFQRPFMSLMVEAQDDRSLGKMKDRLEDVLRTKDILALVDLWTISGLNRDQLAIIEHSRAAVYTALREAGFIRLNDFTEKSEQQLYLAIRPVLAKKHVSKTRTANLCKKLIGGATSTLATLQKAGVKL